MKKIKTLLLSLTVLALLAACGAKDQVSPDRLEEARQTAKANSEFNAMAYKAANPRFDKDFAIIGRSDDGQNAGCPQGDGWAELSIMKVVDKAVDKTVLMCSTYSPSVGCYRKEEFDKLTNLAQQNSGCNREIPLPLPALRK